MHCPQHSVRMSLPRLAHNPQRGESDFTAAALRRAGLLGFDLLMRAHCEPAQGPEKDNSDGFSWCSLLKKRWESCANSWQRIAGTPGYALCP